MSQLGKRQLTILFLWIAWEAIQATAAIFGILVDAEGALGTLQRGLLKMSEYLLLEVLIPLSFLAALTAVTVWPARHRSRASENGTPAAAEIALVKHFVAVDMLPAFDICRNIFFTFGATDADVSADLARRVVELMDRRKHRVQRLFQMEAKGQSVAYDIMAAAIKDFAEAYFALNAMAAVIERGSDLSSVERQIAESRLKEHLSQLIGELPDNSPLRRMLEWARRSSPPSS